MQNLLERTHYFNSVPDDIEALYEDVVASNDCDEVVGHQFEYIETDDIEILKEYINSVNLENAWLKSENMKMDSMLIEYKERFTRLKSVQKEFLTIINQQSDAIRTLKGYAHSKDAKEKRADKGSGISLWMLLPMSGLFLTAFIEVVKQYHIHSLNDVLLLFSSINFGV